MTNKGLITITALLLAGAAHAEGTTANGCTYQVINGKYLYSCEAKTPNTERVPSTTLVEPAPQTMTVAVAPPANQVVRYDTVSTISADPESTFSSSKSPSDAVYVGAQIGSSTISENGSTTGLGLSVSANVDENVGFEIGYSYAKSDLFLGLAQRNGGTPTAGTPTNTYGSTLKTTDSTLTAHLISGEMQFFLTDYNKRLRPYAGVGLGWKSSTLDEDTAYSSGYSTQAPTSSSLSQSSLGLVASLGTKFQISKKFLASVAFRAYRPFSTQNPTLNSGSGYALGGPSATTARLSTADSVLTEAGLYQIVGGFHVAF